MSEIKKQTKFDPKKHLEQIKGKDYLPVAWRLVWFREDHPDWSIVTNIEKLAEGAVIFKAQVYNGSELVATAHKTDRKTNFADYIEKAECVPLETKILTRDGFKFYYQVHPGDKILTVNPETLEYEWNPIEGVSTFKDRPVVRITTSRFSAVCTPNHKWIYSEGKETRLLELDKVRSYGKLVLVGKRSQDLPSDDAARLGWLFSDGRVGYLGSGLPTTSYIKQSKAKNFEQLEYLFGNVYSETEHSAWMTARLWTVSAEKVRDVLSKFDVVGYRDLPVAVSRMNDSELVGFYEAMTAADGSGRTFDKTYLEIVEAVQIAACRLGIKTGAIRDHFKKKSTKPLYTLPIHKTNGAYVSEFQVDPLPPTSVWCPTVKNGTWVAKQNGQVWVTGNTGAIGRALAHCGYGTQFAPETEEGERIADAPVADSAPVSTSIPFDQPAPAENVVDNPAIKTAAQVEPKLATTASLAQRRMLFALGRQLGFDGSEVQHLVKEEFKLDSFTTLTTVQAHKMIETWRLSLDEVPQQAEPPLEQNGNQF